MIDEFQHIFSQSEYDLGHTGIVKHTIDTADHRPMKQGLVEPESSQWAANVALVKKKTGELRFCIDYRKINEATKRDVHPLPRIDECL